MNFSLKERRESPRGAVQASVQKQHSTPSSGKNRLMRVPLIALFLMSMMFHIHALPFQQKVTINVKNTPLSSVLKQFRQ